MTEIPHETITLKEQPDELVAKRIISDLIDKGMISEARAEEFTKKLAEGAVSLEDWRLLADLGSEGQGGVL
jgi:hypothetical protein